MAGRRGWHGADIAAPARALAERIDADAFSDDVLEEIFAEVWSGRLEPGFRGAVDRSVHGNVSAIFDVLRGRMPLELARPQPALDLADVCAQLGVPAVEIERAYRVGVAALWGAWSQRVGEEATRAPHSAQEMLVAPSLMMMAYIDHVLGVVMERYESSRAEVAGSGVQLRRLLVLQLLDGSLADAGPELDDRLDYRLADEHLALLLFSGAGPPDAPLLDAIAEAAGARSHLVLQHGPQAWIVWLGSPGGFGPARVARLRRALDGADRHAAVSEPRAGLEGFRGTHEEVVETARVQRAMGPAGHRVLLAGEVRLEALLLADERRARQFVAAELGPLAIADPTFARLRETLLAWLSSGSHVNAAALLGVHENTIRNRIRQAEELLDDALVNRRTELQVALRLERVLQAGRPSDRYL